MSKPAKKNINRPFRVGDRVRFLNHLKEISWGDRKPQEFGFITRIDGAYIYVRPRWSPKKDVIERYPGEIAHA